MRFKDKVVIVTGAGSGIGRATARLFAAEGAHARVSVRKVSRSSAISFSLGPLPLAGEGWVRVSRGGVESALLLTLTPALSRKREREKRITC